MYTTVWRQRWWRWSFALRVVVPLALLAGVSVFPTSFLALMMVPRHKAGLPVSMPPTPAQCALVRAMVKRHRLAGWRAARVGENCEARLEREPGVEYEVVPPESAGQARPWSDTTFRPSVASDQPSVRCRFPGGFALRYKPVSLTSLAWRQCAEYSVTWETADGHSDRFYLTVRNYEDPEPGWDRDLLAALR